MYARVINAVVRPEKMEELLAVVSDELLPAARQQEGSRGILLLTDIGSRRAISVSLWESKEAMLGAEANELLERQLERVLPFLEESPSAHNYRVAGGGLRSQGEDHGERREG